MAGRRLHALRRAAAVCAAAAALSPAAAAAEDVPAGLAGNWVINEELSDDTDDRVEAAIRAGGGRGGRGLFNRREDFYRGGPPEHELYDRISYDDALSIERAGPELRFTYEDGYRRVFHTDGRRTRARAGDFYAAGGTDHSFGHWDGGRLTVEARPRDGGFTIEHYTLEEGGARLRVEMLIQPDSFRAPISLTRVFDRAAP